MVGTACRVIYIRNRSHPVLCSQKMIQAQVAELIGVGQNLQLLVTALLSRSISLGEVREGCSQDSPLAGVGAR